MRDTPSEKYGVGIVTCVKFAWRKRFHCVSGRTGFPRIFLVLALSRWFSATDYISVRWVLMAHHAMGSPFNNGFVCMICPFHPWRMATLVFPMGHDAWPLPFLVRATRLVNPLQPIYRESQNSLHIVAENRWHNLGHLSEPKMCHKSILDKKNRRGG